MGSVSVPDSHQGISGYRQSQANCDNGKTDLTNPARKTAMLQCSSTINQVYLWALMMQQQQCIKGPPSTTISVYRKQALAYIQWCKCTTPRLLQGHELALANQHGVRRMETGNICNTHCAVLPRHAQSAACNGSCMPWPAKSAANPCARVLRVYMGFKASHPVDAGHLA